MVEARAVGYHHWFHLSGSIRLQMMCCMGRQVAHGLASSGPRHHRASGQIVFFNAKKGKQCACSPIGDCKKLDEQSQTFTMTAMVCGLCWRVVRSVWSMWCPVVIRVQCEIGRYVFKQWHHLWLQSIECTCTEVGVAAKHERLSKGYVCIQCGLEGCHCVLDLQHTSAACTSWSHINHLQHTLVHRIWSTPILVWQFHPCKCSCTSHTTALRLFAMISSRPCTPSI
mmetsp:Transcript_15747/g.27896  ORF Transcript_15747/g.27896 Transcript_15747/m.27896 type:complete len:226 (-) Transcript_15747:75-752(-)